MEHFHRPVAPTPAASFPTDPAGLTEAGRPELLEPSDGDVLDLQVVPVAKRLGDTTVRMLSYNHSIPGPTLKVDTDGHPFDGGSRHDLRRRRGSHRGDRSWRR